MIKPFLTKMFKIKVHVGGDAKMIFLCDVLYVFFTSGHAVHLTYKFVSFLGN